MNTDTQQLSRDVHRDLEIADEVEVRLSNARLLFDGYYLHWKEAESDEKYSAFSGAAEEDVRESVKDIGPTPQGLFAVDPANIENLKPDDAWGKYCVRIEPYASTVKRMSNCFKLVRTGMYIHGGAFLGTHGCIELNNDSDETSFFSRLKTYGKRVELEVKYAGEREKRYEESACPY